MTALQEAKAEFEEWKKDPNDCGFGSILEYAIQLEAEVERLREQVAFVANRVSESDFMGDLSQCAFRAIERENQANEDIGEKWRDRFRVDVGPPVAPRQTAQGDEK